MRGWSRSGRLGSLLFFSLSWLFLLGLTTTAAASKPNIVLIMADDLGWQDLGYHGSEIETPHIDSLAESGLVLERFYVQPICSPTRAAVMTGKSAARLGLYQPISKLDPGGLPLEETLMPEFLSAGGYQALMVGKWHLGHAERAYFPQARGFEHFYGHVTGGIGYWDHNHGGGHDWQRNGVTVREEGYATRLIADEAVRLLEGRDRDRPTFLLASFNAPHLPNEAPDSSLAPYPDSLEQKRRLHAGMVSELDVAVGRILAKLSEQGMRNNTLVWFFSDNGGLNPAASPEGLVSLMDTLVDFFGAPLPLEGLEFVRSNVQDGASDNGPLRAGKAAVYEGGIRVPSVMAWPAQVEAGSSHAFVTAQDVLPTVLQAVGLGGRIPEDLDGVSRWAAIRADEEPDPERDLTPDFRVQGLGQVGLIRWPWKLVVPTPPLPWMEATPELYNILEDPREEDDRAGEEPERVEMLQAALEAQPLGPSVHASILSVALDPDSFGGPEDRAPWAEAAR